MDELLKLICTKNQKFLNLMINRKPQLLSGCMNIVIQKYPSVVGFETKRKYFYAEMQKQE